MGIAIINSQANYTLQRIAQNVIPVDASKRFYLTSVSNFTYEYAGNGIYRLKSLNIGDATQPYTYSLLLGVNQSGVEIDPISGIVTVSSNFTGGNVTVQLNALYSDYYPLQNGATPFTATTTITNAQAPEEEQTTPYNNLTITGFNYSSNTISANGGSSTAPTLTYQYDKLVNNQITTVSNTGGSIEYSMHSISDTGATVNANTGVVSVPSNATQVQKCYVIQAKVTVDGNYQTEVTKITQEALDVPAGVTYTYAFSNVSLSYSGTPVAATGNSAGLTPTLTYTLTKTGSDSSSETISASSIAYSVQGTQPNGVTLNTGTGKVTFAENATDNPVSVTIKATLTAPDGTEATPTATLTQNTRALTGISFKSYSGFTTIYVTPGTTINNTDIAVNLIYNVGANGTATSTKLSIGPNGTKQNSLTFDTAGTYPLTIQYDTFTDNSQSVVVTSSTAKAYISGFPTQSAEGANDGPYHINIDPNRTTHEWPLYVMVTRADGTTVEEKTFTEYLALTEPKETYSAPEVNVVRTFMYDNMVDVDPTDGTLIYDFPSKSDYTYDAPKTKVNSITLTCTSDSTKSATSTTLRINADRYDSSYFNTNNFDEEDLLAVDQNSGNYKYIDALSHDFRVTAESESLEKIKLESDGTVYKLKKLPEYYFKISGTGADTINGPATIAYGGIISRANPASGDYQLSSANPYNTTNTKIIDLGHIPRTIYVKHTPIIESGKSYQDYTTYIVDGFQRTTTYPNVYLDIKVLIPKNNS